MKKVLIFGIGDLAELLLYHLKRESIIPAAFVVHQKFMRTKSFCDIEVVPFESLSKDYPPEEYGVYICIGYGSLNRNRQKMFHVFQRLGYEIFSYIHPTAQVDCQHIGIGTLVFQHVIIDAYTEMGNGNIFYANAFLAHHSIIGDFNFLASSTCIAGHVKISNNCFIGANSTIKNGIYIKQFTLVGAGAYVSKDVPPYSIIASARSVLLEGKNVFDYI